MQQLLYNIECVFLIRGSNYQKDNRWIEESSPNDKIII